MSKKINEIFVYKFNIPVAGLYSVVIEASCQIGENLRVEVDNRKFREIPAQNKEQLFKIPPAWNGNELKGLNKKVIFILRLDKGEHLVSFIPKGAASIDPNPVISLLVDYKLLLDNKAQDGNRRPWITLVLVDLELKILDVSVACEKRRADSDDVKLIIDGNVQKNASSGWWGRNWFWRGSQLAGNTEETRFVPNLIKDLHYIEFWADRTPTIHSVSFHFSEMIKRIPTVDYPKWTGSFNDDTKQMILARAIFGEARGISTNGKIGVAWSIRNRLISKKWGNTYHEVILSPSQYSAFYDKNRELIIDPLGAKNDIDLKAWLKSYEIAEQVIKGEIIDPTDGADHYYSVGGLVPYWTKSPQAIFKTQIDNIRFYHLRTARPGGHIKILLLIILCVAGTGILVFLLNERKIQLQTFKSDFELTSEERQKAANYISAYVSADVKSRDLEKSLELLDLDTLLLVANKYGDVFFKDGNLITPVDYKGQSVFYLQFSPDMKQFGFMATSKKTSWEDHRLIIMDTSKRKIKEIFRGDYHTSWEWAGDQNVIVRRGCGTACMYAYRINASTGKTEAEYFILTPFTQLPLINNGDTNIYEGTYQTN